MLLWPYLYRDLPLLPHVGSEAAMNGSMQASWSPYRCSLQPGTESLLSLAGSRILVLCVPVSCRPTLESWAACLWPRVRRTAQSATGCVPNRWQSAQEARPGATRTASPQRTGWKQGSSRAASWRRASQSPWLAGVPLLSEPSLCHDACCTAQGGCDVRQHQCLSPDKAQSG